jgi:hypothetical protein
MNQKAIVGNVVVAVATAVIMGVIAWAVGVFEKGTDAQAKETIREVLNETLITDAGKTYGQALSEIGLGLNTVSTQVGELQTDVNQLEDAVLALASE